MTNRLNNEGLFETENQRYEGLNVLPIILHIRITWEESRGFEPERQFPPLAHDVNGPTLYPLDNLLPSLNSGKSRWKKGKFVKRIYGKISTNSTKMDVPGNFRVGGYDFAVTHYPQTIRKVLVGQFIRFNVLN